MTDELDPRLRRAVEALRESVPVDQGAVERVKASIPAGSRARGPRDWLRWMTIPRVVRISPVQALGAVCVVAMAAILIGRAILPGSPADPPVAALAAPSAVQFVLVAEDARSVVVVGDFNDWDATATPLHPVGSGGMWTASVPLPQGRYTYSFVVDGTEWVRDPAAPPAPEEDFGRPNSVLLVSAREM